MSSPVTFVDRARKDLGTPGIAALEAGARRLTAGRQNAGADFSDMEPMRDQARSIRLHALGHLDELLGRFADKVEELGGQVHFAADGAEAIAYIRSLAARENVKRIVKSKSMVTEEIHLNAALEEDDLEVVETDLGESFAEAFEIVV